MLMISLKLPSLPASCNWILSISMGVVIMTWHIPAQHPANISLSTVNLLLETREQGWKKEKEKGMTRQLIRSNTHPSLLSWWRKKSLAASLMAFSGVTRVRFTAAPAITGIGQLKPKDSLMQQDVCNRISRNRGCQ